MRISIVIPVYNVEEYLEACLDSVLANDCTDCEVLLVDDGSTDKSGLLCDRLAAEHPALVRVIHQDNRGLGGARNTGIETAIGEYLLFIDSDDAVAPETVARLRQAIDAWQPDLISFRMDRVFPEGSSQPVTADRGPVDRPFTLAEHPEWLLSLPAACVRLWKRSLFTDSGIRFPEGVWYEDIRTSPKLFALAKRAVILPDLLYHYLQRPGSIMNNAKLQRNGEILDAFDDLLAWYRERGLFETYRKELEALAIMHVLLAAAVRVIREDPSHPLPDRFRAYMDREFPDYMRSPYIPGMPWSHRLLIRLLRRRRYRTVRLLFSVKDKL